MINVTKNQALRRWDTLPDNLHEALCSEANSDFLWKTCAAENIPESRIYVVAKLAGYVLLGFLHPEDIAPELVEAIKIDPRTAKSIQDALNGRIFAPLRADIDKIYVPLSKAEMMSSTSGPKTFLDDVNGASKLPPLPVNKVTGPKPSVLSDVGWSRSSTAGPGINLGVISAPSPTAAPAPTASTPTPTPTPAPSVPKEAAPVMLHEDTSFKAAQKNAGFTLSTPGAGAEIHMGQSTKQAPEKPAFLEFGGAKPSAPKPPAPSPALHYTALTLSLSSVPTGDAGPRNVSRITPPVPVPPAVPTPKPPMPPVASIPVPPRPPQAPQTSQTPQPPQGAKPIVKDFL
jgi:hypothetical protein